MPDLIVLVLNHSRKTGEVHKAWLAAGVSGVTILDSTRLAHNIDRFSLCDDLPLVPSLRHFMLPRETPIRTLLAAVSDDFDVDGLVTATEAITGTLDAPEAGILFVVPVRRAWGLRRKPG